MAMSKTSKVWLSAMGGGALTTVPGLGLAYEAWRLASRYRVVRKEDLRRMVDALERAMLDQRASQRVTAAQCEEIETLRRDIEHLEDQGGEAASLIEELAARMERALHDVCGGDGGYGSAPRQR